MDGIIDGIMDGYMGSGWWLTYPSEKYDFVSWDYVYVKNMLKPPTRYMLCIWVPGIGVA